MSVEAKPRGREQIRSAVLTATSALVAERGPDGFSVRDIAARAGVNHALVHRHFGTKADVLEQMLAADDSPEAALPGTASTTELFSGLWRDSDPESAVTTAVAGSSVLGWLIFGAFMSEATGADPEDVRRAVAGQVSGLLSTRP